MEEKYKIEKGVPMPNAMVGRKELYPFSLMDVGDSFFVPTETQRELLHVRSNATTQTHRTDKKFSTRTVDGGIRVWRVS